MFMSTLYKGFLKALPGIQEAGRDCRFMDIRSKMEIGRTGLYLRAGFATNVSLLQDGLFLRIDAINKIDRATTVLEFINEFYHANKELDKDAKRRKL